MKFFLTLKMDADDHLPYFGGLDQHGERTWKQEEKHARPAGKCVVDAVIDAYGDWAGVEITFRPWSEP